VTEDGLKRLAAQHVIIDSLAAVAPSEPQANDDISTDATRPGPVDDAGQRDAGQETPLTDAAEADAGEGPSLLSGTEETARNLFKVSAANRKLFANQAMALRKGKEQQLPPVLQQQRTKQQLRDTDQLSKVFSDLEHAANEYMQNRASSSGPALLGAAEDDTSLPGEELYEVAVKLPMQGDWQETLAKAGGGISSFEPPNIFRIFLSPQELTKVKALPFCESVTRYGIEQTICPSLLQAIGLAPPPDFAGSSGAVAQRSAALAGPAEALQSFDAILHRESDREKAKTAIAQLGGKLTAESPTVLRFDAPSDPGLLAALANRPELKCLAPYHPPQLFSSQARILAGVEQLNQPDADGVTGTWNGDGEIVAVIDSGIDKTHPDLDTQVNDAVAYELGGKSGTADDLVGHGTHVAGIIAGTGAASGGAIRGIAPAAKLVSIGIVAFDVFDRPILLTPPDLGDLLKEATSRDAKIINLSWGTPLGGSYDQGARQLDQFVYNNPQVLVVIAAGNEGRAPEGVHEFNTIGTPASAKNAITVAACGSGHRVDRTYGMFNAQKFGHPVGSMLMSDPEIPAALGSRGPTDYDSVKPDVSACGVYVLAPKAARGAIGWQPPFADHDGRYVYLGGTSMATPVVSGLAAIVRQNLRVQRNITTPSAALVKAILIAAAERRRALTADEGGPFEDRVGYPDFHQGFGRIDLSRVLPHPNASAGRKLLIEDVANDSPGALRSHALAGGTVKDKRDYQVTVSNGASDPLRIVLAWTDFPGNSVQNNLNVYVDGPGGSLYLGNRDLTFKRDALFDNVNLRGVPFDKRNNVEHIKIDNPVPGPYVIRVVAQNTPMANQGYALCIAGCLDEDTLN
jgi:subtilisin family serine protease